jgi:hypothetical protein
MIDFQKVKLGKKPYKHSPLHLQYRALLPEILPPPPPEYDVDFQQAIVWPLPLPVFMNDQKGCCVVAGRANKFMRDEKVEQQGTTIIPTDDEILQEYYKEQGDPNWQTPDVGDHPDDGLYVADSLGSWRKDGWVVSGNKYDIYAYAQVNKARQDEIKSCISLLNGGIVGVTLYETDMKAIENGQIWSTDYMRTTVAGGHCMYVVGYTLSGLKFLTWGQRQVATWDWVMDRVDEFWGVVQNKQAFLGDKSPINTAALDAYLRAVTS